jgi:Bacterial SH3 domain
MDNMQNIVLKLIISIFLLLYGWLLWVVPAVHAGDLRQIPTVAIPTVTGTVPGPLITVRQDTNQEQINVRSGPSTRYDTIGVLIAGQQVPAIGKTPGGDWIQVYYPGVEGSVGWVYSPLVTVPGNLPIIEPPPTPTPRTTPTIDPTLAAQFIVEVPATRMPTFTAPPPLSIPTFTPQESQVQGVGVPMGFIIIGLGVVGLFGALISVLRGG